MDRRYRLCVVARVIASLALLCTAALGVQPDAPQGASSGQPVLEPGTPLLGKPWTATTQEPFRFALLGDKTGGSPGDWPLFDLSIAGINQWKPDFAVMIGDMTEGDSADPARIQEQWQEFKGHIDAFEVPLFVIPGNHDIPNAPALGRWNERLGRTYYSFVYRGCLFVMMNSMELWKDNGASLGNEQVEYVLDTLGRHKDVRHTFLFVHVPYWQDGGNPEWNRIDAALKGRPHTVLAGHIHRNSYEERGGGQYLTVSASKGAQPLAEAPKTPEFGGFPAWGQVVVTDSRARLTLVEPGTDRTWPGDIAPLAYLKALRDLVSSDALMPEKASEGNMKTGFVTEVDNKLAAPVRLDLSVRHPAHDAWKPIEETDAKVSVEVEPGQKKSITQHFLVPETRLTPSPTVSMELSYKDTKLPGQAERNLPLFPKTALRGPETWMAWAAPYEAGPLSSSLPDNPRRDWPRLFESHPEENGYLASKDGTSEWKEISSIPLEGSLFTDLGPLSSLPLGVFSYASAYIHSPSARTIYLQFRVDDFGQILVNGKYLEDGRIFRTRKDPIFVAAPLREGWNNVTVKAINVGGGWSFHLLVADPGKELQFATAKGE